MATMAAGAVATAGAAIEAATPAGSMDPAETALVLADEAVAGGLRRRDLASRRSGDARRMIRFVVDPERRLLPDLAARLPGRGCWVAADAASIERAVKRRAFDQRAGGAVRVPDDLPGLLERLLVQRCQEAIGLGRRAGELVAGFDQVAAALDGSVAGLLIEACDAARHGRRKLAGKQGDGPCVDLLTRAELGQALGRDEVVHAWLRNGRLATRLLDDAARLAGFRHLPAEGERGVDAQQGN